MAISSACDILLVEPDRFIDYIMADSKLRESIYDKQSLGLAVKKAFASDPTLNNIISQIRSSGENLDDCLINMFDDRNMKKLMDRNNNVKKREIRKRVKTQRPNLKGKALKKEVERRLKISKSRRLASIKTRQVSIKDAFKPINVKYKTKKGKTVSYRKANYRPLSKAEEKLILNNIKKSPAEVVRIYYGAGLTFRSKTSIKKHYYRLKSKKI